MTTLKTRALNLLAACLMMASVSSPADDKAPRIVFLGHYDDQFIRENGKWKFLRREAPVDIPAAP